MYQECNAYSKYQKTPILPNFQSNLDWSNIKSIRNQLVLVPGLFVRILKLLTTHKTTQSWRPANLFLDLKHRVQLKSKPNNPKEVNSNPLNTHNRVKSIQLNKSVSNTNSLMKFLLIIPFGNSFSQIKPQSTSLN